jgi:hypothetical protein
MATTQPGMSPTQRTLDDEQRDQLWMDAVNTVTTKAYESMPDDFEAVKTAYNLVFAGKVQPTGQGGFTVATDLPTGRAFWHVNGLCDCPTGGKTSGKPCPHRLAVRLYTRAQDLLHAHSGTPPPATEAPPETSAPPPQDATPTPPAPPAASPPAPAEESTPEAKPRVRVPERYIADIHGTKSIKFAGLLLLAHQDGLTSLKAEFTANTDTLATAHAVAIFNDGRHFEDSGDATEANVGPKVKQHFRRVALTRAKARALKDALGLDLVADVELAE